MGFSHYPKTSDNLVFAWRWPQPPIHPPFPGFRPFSEVNRADGNLDPEHEWVAYADAIGFTRLFFSVKSDQKLLVSLDFSDQETDAYGLRVSDDNISKLDYYVLAKEHHYDPENHRRTCKFFEIAQGRWMRLAIRNVSETPISRIDAYLRGSVF